MNAPLPHGLHFGITDEAYHGDPSERPSLSSTLARLILDRSPLHAWTSHPRLNPNWEAKDSKTFDIGRAAHRAVLGAGSDYVAIPPELLSSNGAASTKAAKEWIAEARESGLTPLKADEVAQIGEMRDRVHARLTEMDIDLDPAFSEATAIAEIAGCPVRARFDNCPEAEVEPSYDFKTTTDASPDHCMRAVMNYGYDVQAAHYLDTLKAATGQARRFRFIFQEKEAPFEVCLVELHPDALDMARKKIRRAREIWANCIASGHWPGYPTGVHMVDLPAWFHERWLERESAEGEYRREYGHDVLDQARRWQAPTNFAAE